MKTTSKMKMTLKMKRPQNEDDLKNEDNLKNEDDIKIKTVPGPSLHNLSCACCGTADPMSIGC